MSEDKGLLSLIKTGAKEISPNTGDGKSAYAATRTVRDSQLSSTMAGSNISTAPGFYSPFLTTTSFQIPNNRKEVYLWASMWYDNDPKVAAGINFYTDFVFSGFELECESSYVKDYFEEIAKKLNFSKWLPMISYEYHLRGDAFPFLTIDCVKCSGSNIDNESGEMCDHEGATWKSISMIDPNQIDISPGFVDKDPALYFQPNDQIIRIVQTGEPREQFNSIPDHLKQLILNKQPIYLDPLCAHHFKRSASAWSPYGTSLVRSLFPTLMLKDKLRQSANVIADRLIFPVKIVKVGDSARPANEQDLQNVQEQLAARAADPLLTIVTHHAFSMEFIQPSVLAQATAEHENIEKDLLDGLMLSSQTITGEGPAYAGMIGAMSLDRRLERFRLEVKQWIEEKIFKPVAIWNGFTTTTDEGNEKVVYPTIKWNDLQLRDETSRLQTLQAMQTAGIVSAETMIEAVGLNYDQEVERLRFEQNSNFNAAGAMGGMPLTGGGMGAGFGGGMGDMGMGGGMMGGMPPAPGAEGDPGMPMPPDMGAPAPGAPPAGAPITPAASSQNDNYRKSSNIIFNLVTSSTNKVAMPKKFKSAAHKDFWRDTHQLTGRGLLGPLDKTFKPIHNDRILMPEDGGPLCEPLNSLATVAMETYRKFVPRKITSKKNKPDEEANITRLFTKLEQSMYTIIMGLNIPLPLYAQVMAGPSQEYTIDAAFPSIRLGIEADSEAFHASPDQVRRDKYRDSVLATEGWTILRFTDKEIKRKPDQVAQMISGVVRQMMQQQ